MIQCVGDLLPELTVTNCVAYMDHAYGKASGRAPNSHSSLVYIAESFSFSSPCTIVCTHGSPLIDTE